MLGELGIGTRVTRRWVGYSKLGCRRWAGTAGHRTFQSVKLYHELYQHHNHLIMQRYFKTLQSSLNKYKAELFSGASMKMVT